MAIRSTAQRVVETLRRLETEADIWISTASPQGKPHLIPLSLAWDGTRILASTPPDTPTVRNVLSTGVARVSLADTDDVVIVVASAAARPFAELEPADADFFAAHAGWDPRAQTGEWSLLTFTPETVFAWRGEPELSGRVIMRHGTWLDA